MLIRLLLDGRWSLVMRGKETLKFDSFKTLKDYAEKHYTDLIEQRKKEGKKNGKYFYKPMKNLETLKSMNIEDMEETRRIKIKNLSNRTKGKYFPEEYEREKREKKLQMSGNRIKMEELLSREEDYIHLMKDYCVVCKEKIPKKFSHYSQKGNYCALCCSKITKTIEEKGFESSTEIINLLENYAQFKN
jgi:uncharacterized protein YicC (UPF0701 family)